MDIIKKHKLGNNEEYVITLQPDTYFSESVAFDNYSDGIVGISEILSKLRIPFDESVIPDQYLQFKDKEISDTNFRVLWEELHRIEDKYSRGIDYYNRDVLTDWDSELCYEQGKYIENVIWVGKDIEIPPDVDIINCTYSKMNYQQLKYYLNWRTCFQRGLENVVGCRSFYDLYASELIANFGNLSINQRMKQLEKLLINFGINSDIVCLYADYNGFTLKNEKVLDALYPNTPWKWEAYVYTSQMLRGDYRHSLDVMNTKSRYKIKKNSFIKHSGCLDYISEVISHMIPKLMKLFQSSDFDFLRMLFGKRKVYIYSYKGIWTRRVEKRIFFKNYNNFSFQFQTWDIFFTDSNGNIIQEKPTSTSMPDYDPDLSEYILRYTEMLFREKLGCQYVTEVKKPAAFKIKLADGYHYAISANPEMHRREKIYFLLYNNIEEIIRNTVQQYFKENADQIDRLKKDYIHSETIRKRSQVEKRIPVEKKIINYINSTPCNSNDIKAIIDIYNDATLYYKKNNSKKLAKLIWDYWVINGGGISYDKLENIVVNNKWYLKEIAAVYHRNYEMALPYFYQFHNPCVGIVSHKVQEGTIEDSIILVLKCLDILLNNEKLDISDFILGKWCKNDWIPYDDVEICIRPKESFVRNVGNLEIYTYDDVEKVGTLSRNSRDLESQKFCEYLMKLIDNQFRIEFGIASLLKNDYDVNKYMNVESTIDITDEINNIVEKVVRFCIVYNKPKFPSHKIFNETIEITESDKRSYSYCNVERNEDSDDLIYTIIERYYGINDCRSILDKPWYDSFNIDISEFKFDDWTKSNSNKSIRRQLEPKINLKYFFNNYDTYEKKLEKIHNAQIEYNPEYKFCVNTGVMKKCKGFKSRDSLTLKSLLENPDEFLQWIEWIRHGKVVFIKNEALIPMFYYFAISNWILPDYPSICLVIMAEMWNHYLCNYEDLSIADLYLSWIKDYWLLNCSNISYDNFKSLFVSNIVFFDDKENVEIDESYSTNFNKLDGHDFSGFYLDNCDYEKSYDNLAKAGYRYLLESSLKHVHLSLTKLWKQYDLDFNEFLRKKDRIWIEKQKYAYCRAILYKNVKDNIAQNFNLKKLSDSEEYYCKFDEEVSWPIVIKRINIESNNSIKILLGYILRCVENTISIWVGRKINPNNLNNAWKLHEIFPDKLFYDNADSHVIDLTIEETTVRTCQESGIIPFKKQTLESFEILNHYHYGSSIDLKDPEEYDRIDKSEIVTNESLNEARKVLAENQRRLVIENCEEIDEEKNTDNEITGNVPRLNNFEKTLLKILLSKNSNTEEDLRKIETECGSIDLLVESINNKTLDIIGDSVISDAGGHLSLVEEYTNDVIDLVKGE